MEYQTLLQERADLVKEAEGLAAKAELSAEESGRFDAIEARLALVKAALARHDKVREEQRAMAGTPITGPGAAQPGVQITGGQDRREGDPTHGFKGVGEFAMAVKAAMSPGGRIDPRLLIGAAPSNYLESAGTSGEGFLLPTEFRQEIYELVFNDPLVDRFTFEPTSTGAVDLLADESTPWGATGVKAYWRSEGSQMTGTKPGIVRRTTRTDQLYAFVTATDELLRDAPLLDSRIRRAAAQAITWKVGEALITGTGAGQPLGILNAAATVSVAKETSQVADTINAANVLKMFARAIKQGGSLFWLANDDVVPQLATMTIGTQPAWMAPSALISAPGGMLLGQPIIFSEHADTVGDKGDLILINPAGYHAIRRTDAPEFASSIHLYFDYGMTAFRWTFEIGGQPFLSAPVTPAKSSSTKSHFVTLDAR